MSFCQKANKLRITEGLLVFKKQNILCHPAIVYEFTLKIEVVGFVNFMRFFSVGCLE